jgi:hypothetical protein
METPNTQQLQLQTLNVLNNLLNTWNQDPLAATNSLIITGNQITILNNSDVLLSLTIPIGTEIENSTQELEKEQDSLENLLSDINLDNLISLIKNISKEFISLLQKEPEVLNEENLEEISSSRETENQLPLNNILAKLINNLATKKKKSLQE